MSDQKCTKCGFKSTKNASNWFPKSSLNICKECLQHKQQRRNEQLRIKPINLEEDTEYGTEYSNPIPQTKRSNFSTLESVYLTIDVLMPNNIDSEE